MSLRKRRLVLAATATTLAIGGVLLPTAGAMAAPMPDRGVTVPATATAMPKAGELCADQWGVLTWCSS